MYRILEFFQTNPRANAIDTVKRFEAEFEIPTNLKILKDEIPKATTLKRELRVLYAKRRDVEEKMRYLLSDIEMEIYLEFPPRKGSDAQREAMRLKLKRANVDYMELEEQYKGFTMQIDDFDDQYKMLEADVKKARRMMETFNHYVAFITEYSKGL